MTETAGSRCEIPVLLLLKKLEFKRNMNEMFLLILLFLQPQRKKQIFFDGPSRVHSVNVNACKPLIKETGNIIAKLHFTSSCRSASVGVLNLK